MSKVSNKCPKASRPLEYVCFFTVQVKTEEGPAFIFMAVDAYSQFAFNTGVEKDDSPGNIIKHIYLLTEDEKFKEHMDNGFTLVLHKYEELSARINSIIELVGGKLIINEEYHNHVVLPAIKSIRQTLRDLKA